MRRLRRDLVSNFHVISCDSTTKVSGGCRVEQAGGNLDQDSIRLREFDLHDKSPCRNAFHYGCKCLPTSKHSWNSGTKIRTQLCLLGGKHSWVRIFVPEFPIARYQDTVAFPLTPP